MCTSWQTMAPQPIPSEMDLDAILAKDPSPQTVFGDEEATGGLEEELTAELISMPGLQLHEKVAAMRAELAGQWDCS